MICINQELIFIFSVVPFPTQSRFPSQKFPTNVLFYFIFFFRQSSCAPFPFIYFLYISLRPWGQKCMRNEFFHNRFPRLLSVSACLRWVASIHLFIIPRIRKKGCVWQLYSRWWWLWGRRRKPRSLTWKQKKKENYFCLFFFVTFVKKGRVGVSHNASKDRSSRNKKNKKKHYFDSATAIFFNFYI